MLLLKLKLSFQFYSFRVSLLLLRSERRISSFQAHKLNSNVRTRSCYQEIIFSLAFATGTIRSLTSVRMKPRIQALVHRTGTWLLINVQRLKIWSHFELRTHRVFISLSNLQKTSCENSPRDLIFFHPSCSSWTTATKKIK